MTSYRLSRGEPDALPALQVANRKGMIVINFALACDRNRQLDE